VVVPILPMAVPRKTIPSWSTNSAEIFDELTSGIQISLNCFNHLVNVGKM